MKWIWINKEHIAKAAFTIVGGIYALLGFIGMLVPLDEILPESISIWVKILIGCLLLIGSWLICFAIVAIVLFHKKRFQVFRANGGHALYLQYGDIFDSGEVLKPEERRNIVIPVNRCFDTIVDNRLISEQTIHGIAFKRLYESGGYSGSAGRSRPRNQAGFYLGAGEEAASRGGQAPNHCTGHALLRLERLYPELSVR